MINYYIYTVLSTKYGGRYRNYKFRGSFQYSQSRNMSEEEFNNINHRQDSTSHLIHNQLSTHYLLMTFKILTKPSSIICASNLFVILVKYMFERN